MMLTVINCNNCQALSVCGPDDLGDYLGVLNDRQTLVNASEKGLKVILEKVGEPLFLLAVQYSE